VITEAITLASRGRRRHHGRPFEAKTIAASDHLADRVGFAARKRCSQYPDAMPFDNDDLRAIDRAKEIEVETSAGPDSEVHRTITWVVVDGDDVFVRSWRGVTARWFREALANPNIAIHIDGRRVAARAVPARDPGSIARTSAGLVKKYDGDTSTPSMVRDEILETTLRLDPVTTD